MPFEGLEGLYCEITVQGALSFIENEEAIGKNLRTQTAFLYTACIE